MSLHLAVISSAERLRPHDDATDAVFGVSLVAAAVAPAAGDLDWNWLEPWNWDAFADGSATAFAVWVTGMDVNGAAINKAVAARVWAHPAPVSGADRVRAIAALQRRRDDLATDAAAGVTAFRWAVPLPPRPDRGFHREVVGSAATLSGALAHGLNLAATLKIAWTEFPDSYFTDPAADKRLFGPDVKLFFVPAVSRGGHKLTPDAGGPTAIPDAEPLVQWNYTPTGSAPSAAEAYTARVRLDAEDKPDRYFRLSSYWVGEPTGAAPVDPGDDWKVKLADCIADAWNLPRHLLDAVAGLSSLTQGEYEEIWKAVLAATRDRAGVGLIDTPDGKGLLRLATDRAVPPKAAQRHWRVESFRERLRWRDRSVTLVEWREHLAKALPAALAAKLPAAPPVIAGSVTPAALEPLARAAGAVQDDAVLAALVGSQWEQFATGQASLVPPGGGVDPAPFGPMYVRRDFRTDAPNSFAHPRWVESGTLDLTNGDNWVVTLAAVAVRDTTGAPVWNMNRVYELEFESGADALIVRATYAIGGPPTHPKLEVQLFQRGVTPIPSPGNADFPAGTTAHDLRVLFRKDVAGTVVMVAVMDPSTQKWMTPTVVASVPPGLNLSATRIWVRYLPGPSDMRLTFAPPTVFSAPPADFDVQLAGRHNVPNQPDITGWDELSVDPVRNLWEEFGTAFRAALPILQPRRRLALGQSARLWPVWNFYDAAITDHRELVKQRVRGVKGALRANGYLWNLAAQRFGWDSGDSKAPGLYDDFAPVVAITQPTLQTAIDNHLESFADTLVERGPLLPITHAAAPGAIPDELDADREAAPTPHGWTVAVDRADTFAEHSLGNDDDLTRRVAGVGALLRQASPTPAVPADPCRDQPWRVLTAADVLAVMVDPTDPSQTTTGPAVSRAAVPVRGRFQDDARLTVLTYDNQPLVARSPLAAVATAKQTLKETFNSSLDRFGPFQLAPCEKLPTLKFGQFYELLPFLVGNTGALPKALAAGHPSALAPTGAPAEAGVPTDFVRRLRYLRRVPVGEPRLPPTSGGGARLPAQARAALSPPAGVLPLARELGIRAVAGLAAAERYFFDPARGTGQLVPGPQWTLTVPRVVATGAPYGDFAGSQWAVRFGLAGDVASGAAGGVGFTIDRTAGPVAQLTPQVNGTPEATKPVPGLPATGAIDLRLDWDGTTLAFRWRPSDRAATWTDGPTWTPAVPVLVRAGVRVEAVPSKPAPTFSLPVVNQDTPRETVAQVPDAPLAVLKPITKADDPTKPRPGTILSLPLRPPGTDLQTWARWYDADLLTGQAGATLPLRDEVWKAYHGLLPEAGAPAGADVSFDDPAVSGVVFELVPLVVDGPSPGPLPPPVFVRANATGPSGMGRVQADPWSVAVNQGAGDRLTFTGTAGVDGGVLARVREKEVWELRAYPAVDVKFFAKNAPKPGDQRFHSQFGDTVEYTEPVSGRKYRLFPAWRLTVEVATRDVIQLTPAEVAALRLNTVADKSRAVTQARFEAAVGWAAFTAGFDGRRIRAALDKRVGTSADPVPTPALAGVAGAFATTLPVGPIPLPGDPWRFRYVTGVRVRRQVWRWRGRPVPPLPFEAAAAPDAFPAATDGPATNLMLWDAPGFGDRSGLDLLDESRIIGYATPTAELFSEDLTRDPRALYYRFAAQFTSRYAGLFPVDPPDLIAAQLGQWDAQISPWRRVVVPCRRTAAVPRPAVRFVVPLTQSAEDAARTRVPGLLVVLDEPAFATGGLAEVIEAEVARADDKWLNGPPVSRPQFGPDPTLRGEGWTRSAHPSGGSPDTDPPAAALAVSVDGPIGHTFDTDAEAPLFVAASYLLNPPDVAPITGDPTLAWYFARVRFRRQLLPEGTPDWPAPVTPGGTNYPLGTSPADPEPLAVTVSALTVASGGTATAALLDTVAGVTRGTATITRAGPVVTVSYDSPPAAVTFDTDPGTDVRLDLRFVLQMEEARSDTPGDDPPPRHLSVSYRVGAPATAPRANTWRTLQAAEWPAGAAWPDRLTLSQAGAAVRTQPARLSRFTPPYWVQFLPSAAALLPDKADTFGIRWAAFDERHPNQDDVLKFDLLDPLTGTPVEPTASPGWELGLRTDWPPAADGADTRFVRRLLLTEVVRDVRGQPAQERYLGLYEASGGRLACAHRSPALAAMEREQRLARVRVRVVEFQEDTARAVALAEFKPPPDRLAQKTPWNALFDPVDRSADPRTADTPARVVRVSPPVNLTAAGAQPPTTSTVTG